MKFDNFESVFANIKIVENKLLIKRDVATGYEIGEIMFQHDDRDRTPIYENKEIEFLLPINHKLSIKFKSDFTITYKELDGIKYFFKIDVFLKMIG